MIKFSFTTKIARPPSVVFAFLADPANLPKWQGTHAVEKLTDGPIGVGSRFREVHRAPGRSRIESITEVTEYEPGVAFAVRIVEGPVPIDGSWKLEPARDEGTDLRFTASGRGPGPRFLQPLVAAGAKREFRRQHKELRSVIESLPARPPQPQAGDDVGSA